MGEIWAVVGVIALAFMAWIGKKAFKGEYEKGRQDEKTKSNDKVKELAKKLYANPTSHFVVGMPGRWRTPTKARTDIRVESDTGDSIDK